MTPAIQRIAFLFLFSFSSYSFAGHPAADRMVDILEEGVRIINLSGATQKKAMCRFISKYVDHQTIATELLGSYNRGSDSSGVREFKREAESFMATKAFPKLQSLSGESGSFDVSDRVTNKPGGKYSVPVTIRTSKGKTYNGRAILNSSLDLVDVEYLGFSGVSYVGRDVRKEISKFDRTSAPVSNYLDDLRSSEDFIPCR